MSQIGDNKPPAEEVFRDRIDVLTKHIDEICAEGITDENAGRARDLMGDAKTLAKEIDELRKKEKAPHITAGKEIDQKFTPLRDEAKEAADPVARLLAIYAQELQRKAAEERAANEAAAEAEREALERKQQAAAALADDPLIGNRAEREAKQAEREAKQAEIDRKAREAESREASKIKGRGDHRALSIRTTRNIRVTDIGALVAFYADNIQMQELAEKIARQFVRSAAFDAEHTPPGVEVFEEQTAV